MTKQLTASEYQSLMDSRSIYEDDTLFSKPDTRAGFSAGFVAGLSHNQAKLNSERQERIAFNEQVSAKLDKLISFIKGEITRSEIEGLLE